MSERLAPEQDVVLSSRVRLARNYENVPFSPIMDQQGAEETIFRAEQSVKQSADGAHYKLYRMKELTQDARKRLVEHHLISYDLLKYADHSAALISDGETISIMINEEDHLRIQGLLPGLQLLRAAELAYAADDQLSKDGQIAFDPKIGYLTSCPTNTGTGMRASTMIHLPSLSATGQIGAIIQMVSKLGLTVRGLYGEGSDAQGYLYQLSNQVTLGRTEEDMINSLIAVTQQIAGIERSLRDKLSSQESLAVADRLMRSIGIMAYARSLTLAEFMQRYSDLRLAAIIGYTSVSLCELDAMMMDFQPSSLNVRAGGELSEEKQNELRADLTREFVNKSVQLSEL